MQFVHTFAVTKAEDATYFALSYPFSYQDSVQKFAELGEKYKSSTAVYFHSETAVHTIEGRAMQLITVSSFDKITAEREEVVPGLFPEHSEGSPRPYKYIHTYIHIYMRDIRNSAKY